MSRLADSIDFLTATSFTTSMYVRDNRKGLSDTGLLLFLIHAHWLVFKFRRKIGVQVQSTFFPAVKMKCKEIGVFLVPNR